MLKIILALIFSIISVFIWIEIYLEDKKKRYLIIAIITMLGEISWFIHQGYFLEILNLIKNK